MEKTLQYKITDVDYWERDALLLVNGKNYYFQFDKEPTIEEALEFFKKDSRYYTEPKDEQMNGCMELKNERTN